MIAPYQKIKNFLRRSLRAGCTERQKLATKVAQFFSANCQAHARQNALSFFTKKEQKKIKVQIYKMHFYNPVS